MSLGTLTVDLVMKTGKFETDTKRAEKRAKEMAKNIDATVSKVGTALASAAVIGFGAFAVGVKSAIDAADQMGEAAEKIGVTTEALSELAFAAKLSAVEQETLQKALAKVSVDMAKQDSTLKALGITATTADDAFAQLATLFKEMPDGIEKTAAAAKIFGERIGPDLIPLLNRGADGIDALRERARELGVTLSSETAQAAGEFNDSMDEIRYTMDGAFRVAANDLLPTMQSLAQYMSGPEFREGFGAVISGIGQIIDFSIRGVSALGGLGQSIRDALSADSQKTYTGLLAKRWNIEDDIGKLKGGIFSKASMVAGGSSGEVNPLKGVDANIAALEKELAEIDKRINAVRDAKNQSALAGQIAASVNLPPAASGGSRLGSILGGKEGGAKAASASRTKTDSDREAEIAARDLASANELLNGILDRQAEAIGGPVVAAAMAYAEEMTRIQEVEDELIRLNKLDADALEFLNLAREQSTKLYREEQQAIADRKTPAEEELQRLRDELALLGLTNEERAKRIFMMNNPGATEADGDEAARLVGAIDQANRAQQAMDEFRSSAADAFEGFLTGSMSAKDAFEAFADSVVQQIARILAQQAIESLFGGMGSAGGGSFGGSIGSFFGSLFGGGRAVGGAVHPGRYYRVNENGPELLTYQGEDYLMMGSGGGMVKPHGGGGANITVNVAPTTDRRTAQQIAQRVAEKQQTAVARNR